MEDWDLFFKYELTTEPTSLFKNGLMRKPDKSSLRKILMPKTILLKDRGSYQTTVLDGGSLIHRVRWIKGSKFKEISKTYVNYIFKNYSNPLIVFDGYGAPSTKDQEHIRRNSVPLSSFIKIEKQNEVTFSQDKYLTLQENKAEVVLFLHNCFLEAGIKSIQCSGDADTTIVNNAIRLCEKQDILVVADDSDIAIMLFVQ